METGFGIIAAFIVIGFIMMRVGVKRKFIATIGKIIISIMLILIFKFLVHYFLFPSSNISLDDNVDYHTRLENPHFLNFIPDDDSLRSERLHWSDRLSTSRNYISKNKKTSGFYLYKADSNAPIEAIDPENIDNFKKDNPDAISYCPVHNSRYIYLYYFSMENHFSPLLSWSIPSSNAYTMLDGSIGYKWDISDVREGRYLPYLPYYRTTWGVGYNNKAELYRFIIPIYILLYWLASKYRKRKKKRV